MELSILHALQGLHTEWLNSFMIFVSALGDNGLVWIALSLAFLVVPGTRRRGLNMLLALAFSFLVGNLILKNLIARPRPFTVDTQVTLLIPVPSEYSFPSGHTLSSFTAAVTLFLYHRLWGFAACILASLIAFSRMYLFVHYPTDILGGILLGILDAFIVRHVLELISRKNVAPGMEPSSDGRRKESDSL